MTSELAALGGLKNDDSSFTYLLLIFSSLFLEPRSVRWVVSKIEFMSKYHVGPPGEKTFTMRRHSDVIGLLAAHEYLA